MEVSLPTAYFSSTLNDHILCFMTIAVNLGKGDIILHVEMKFINYNIKIYLQREVA